MIRVRKRLRAAATGGRGTKAKGGGGSGRFPIRLSQGKNGGSPGAMLDRLVRLHPTGTPSPVSSQGRDDSSTRNLTSHSSPPSPFRLPLPPGSRTTFLSFLIPQTTGRHSFRHQAPAPSPPPSNRCAPWPSWHLARCQPSMLAGAGVWMSPNAGPIGPGFRIRAAAIASADLPYARIQRPHSVERR